MDQSQEMMTNLLDQGSIDKHLDLVQRLANMKGNKKAKLEGSAEVDSNSDDEAENGAIEF